MFEFKPSFFTVDNCFSVMQSYIVIYLYTYLYFQTELNGVSMQSLELYKKAVEELIPANGIGSALRRKNSNDFVSNSVEDI